jgi:hypothetical protein
MRAARCQRIMLNEQNHNAFVMLATLSVLSILRAAQSVLSIMRAARYMRHWTPTIFKCYNLTFDRFLVLSSKSNSWINPKSRIAICLSTFVFAVEEGSLLISSLFLKCSAFFSNNFLRFPSAPSNFCFAFRLEISKLIKKNLINFKPRALLLFLLFLLFLSKF